MEFANMSGLDALDDTADARAVGAASEEPVADVDMADVVTAHGDFECALRDRPQEDPALWRLVDSDGQLWRCGSRGRIFDANNGLHPAAPRLCGAGRVPAPWVPAPSSASSATPGAPGRRGKRPPPAARP